MPSSLNFHTSLAPFNTPVRDWLAANPRHHLLVSAVVTLPSAPSPSPAESPSPSPPDTSGKEDKREHDTERVLLLQRAPTDYAPLAWEFPGGTCEPEETVLQAVARELWEESGLVARSVDALVDEREVPEPRYGTVEDPRVRPMWRMVFERGMPVVRLDPEEHCAFCWASEEDVKRGECEGVRLEWDRAGGGRREVILRGFEVLRERRERGLLMGGGGVSG
ncbi:NUDIX hydrolase domain-like protein [Parachaetomium inaequale]|uniref:NUDIX hydrolase domain-like protein n=1 Tax=Parachaetomium inaequale TaxID=2588326 RepID=A0AAN6PEJ3_9PEZI|nr:NUDIX hydrolase domain-like protein [Parachaetomium inaequale]